MVSSLCSIFCIVLALASRRIFGQSLKLFTFRAGCIVLPFLVGGAWNIAAAQQYNGAQRTLGSGFIQPNGVAVDAGGDVFVADSANNAVKELVAVNGRIPDSPTIRTLGSGFIQPASVAVDAGGDVFVADSGNNAVKEMVAVDGSITDSPTIRTLGSGFIQPASVAVDAGGNVFVADSGNNAVKEMVAVDGSIPDSPTIRTWNMTRPTGVAVDASGNVFVAGNAVSEMLAVGGIVPDSPTITTLGSMDEPLDVAVDAKGDVFVVDCGYRAEEMLAVSGSIPSTPTTLMLGAQASCLSGVAVDGSGNVFVTDSEGMNVNEIMPGAANFGQQLVGTASSAVTMSFTVPGGTTIGSEALLTLGNANMDFADAGGSTCAVQTYSGNTDCVVNVKFTPLAPGLRSGALALYDGAGNPLGSWRVYGVGLGVCRE